MLQQRHHAPPPNTRWTDPQLKFNEVHSVLPSNPSLKRFEPGIQVFHEFSVVHVTVINAKNDKEIKINILGEWWTSLYDISK